MASYSIKIVDHTKSDDSIKTPIQSELQTFFNRVFQGTQDSASIAWGSGDRADTIVLHFVGSVAESYIRQTMPKPPKLDPDIGGHTSLRGHVVCSEFYKNVNARHGHMNGHRYAKLAFHECLHNVFPGWQEPDLNGHGGLSDSPVGHDLNQWDIDTMRRGIGIKSVTVQKL